MDIPVDILGQVVACKSGRLGLMSQKALLVLGSYVVTPNSFK